MYYRFGLVLFRICPQLLQDCDVRVLALCTNQGIGGILRLAPAK